MKILRVVVYALVLGAKTPWIVLHAGLSLLHVIARLGRVVAQHYRHRGAVVECVDHHANPLVGRWKCRCGFEFVGHAFVPCPSCGEEAGWFPCRSCGLGVQDPLQH